MFKNKSLINTSLAVAAALAFTSVTTTSAIAAATKKANNMEKCYGITKTAMNDCETATASCAGSSKKDNTLMLSFFYLKALAIKL